MDVNAFIVGLQAGAGSGGGGGSSEADVLTALIEGYNAVDIKNDSTRIRDYAFYWATRIENVEFPAAISIGQHAFNTCSRLKTADFPVATEIGPNAFGNCYSLTALILRSETLCTMKSADMFDNCKHFIGEKNSAYNPTGAKDGYIYVPTALVNSYRSATNWSKYSTRIRELEGYTVDGTITGELDPNKI